MDHNSLLQEILNNYLTLNSYVYKYENFMIKMFTLTELIVLQRCILSWSGIPKIVCHLILHGYQCNQTNSILIIAIQSKYSTQFLNILLQNLKLAN